jgi:tRNA(Arg) A34 adenosine deaminase TadA
MLGMVLQITENPLLGNPLPAKPPGFWIKIPYLNDCTMPIITNVTPAAMCISALLFRGIKRVAEMPRPNHSWSCENTQWE